MTDGRVQAGLIIPAEFSRDLEKGRQATVQFVLNAMDANTATVAKTCAEGVVSAYGKGVRGSGVHVRFDEAAAAQSRGQAASSSNHRFSITRGCLPHGSLSLECWDCSAS
jgi:ABC-2 type transport system permease protein